MFKNCLSGKFCIMFIPTIKNWKNKRPSYFCEEHGNVLHLSLDGNCMYVYKLKNQEDSSQWAEIWDPQMDDITLILAEVLCTFVLKKKPLMVASQGDRNNFLSECSQTLKHVIPYEFAQRGWKACVIISISQIRKPRLTKREFWPRTAPVSCLYHSDCP